MDEEYHEVTAELDAREILRYLNTLGIQNISGEVLKYFITDLKKLIKYDLQQKRDNANSLCNQEPSGPERLHSASTFSSRIRSKGLENIPMCCNRDCQSVRSRIRNVHSAPVLRQRKNDNAENTKPLRKSCSCIRVEKKPETTPKEKSTSSNNNLIKVAKQPPMKKCDPVSLYHYYTSLWAKYKSNVPGENNWSDLRWTVRQKMAGSFPKPTGKIFDIQQKEGTAKK